MKTLEVDARRRRAEARTPIERRRARVLARQKRASRLEMFQNRLCSVGYALWQLAMRHRLRGVGVAGQIEAKPSH